MVHFDGALADDHVALVSATVADEIHVWPFARTTVRCFFAGKPESPNPTDLSFARVPCVGERVVYEDEEWAVARVTWTQGDGPFLSLSYVA